MFTPSETFHGKHWYVFYTHAKAETTAGASIAELGFPVFVPTERRIQRLPNGRPRPKENALFPRYGFVKFEADRDAWPAILDAKGVMDLLRHNQTPIPVPNSCVNALQLAQNVGIFDRTKPPRIGQEVQITAGPFTGLFGKILRARTADRMDVLLKFLGAECNATIPLVALKEIA